MSKHTNIALFLILLSSTPWTNLLCMITYRKNFNSIDTYKEKKITTKNILTTGEQDIPENVLEKIRKFYENNKDFYQDIVNQPGNINSIENLKKIYKKAEDRLKKNNITRFKSHNLVFESPSVEGYIEKISGPFNRAQHSVINQGKRYGEFDKLDQNKIVEETYQTASRKFYYLRTTEAIEKYKLNKIIIPKSALISLSKQQLCSDKYCVFIEEKMTNYKNLSEYKDEEIKKIITQDVLCQLITLVVYAGLWDIKRHNTMFNDTNKKLAIIDMEQPNIVVPKERFHGTENRYKYFVRHGFETLYKMLPETSELREYLKQLILSKSNRYIMERTLEKENLWSLEVLKKALGMK